MKKFQAALIFAFCVLIGLLGWYFWQTRKTESSRSNDPTEGGKYLVIDQYKVRIPTNQQTEGLKLSNPRQSFYNQEDQFVTVIAPELDAAWNCAADENGIKGSIGSISITTKPNRSGPYSPLQVKKLGDYTFGFEALTTSNCTDSRYSNLVKTFSEQFTRIESF